MEEVVSAVTRSLRSMAFTIGLLTRQVRLGFA
jgi:hypothetical protein